MYQCSSCNRSISEKYESICPACKVKLAFCSHCQQYTERRWHTTIVRLQLSIPCRQFHASCSHCGGEIWDSRHIRKSSLYQHYRFSFKFVNRYTIPYTMYFHHQFPFGEDNIDLGLCVNPFSFDDGTNEEDKKLANTDLGLARAYQVSLRNGAKTDQYITLSYESGLEIFPPMVAVSKENTIARGVLRQSLELIEANINWWWERYKSDYWGPSKVVSFLPLVEKILIRTPYWQFAIDDSFIPGDRKLIFEQIAVTTRTSETIEEFLASSNAMIGRKILETSRRIAKVL